MARKGRIDVRLGTQVLLLQIVVVVLTLGLAFGLFAYLSGRRLTAEYGSRALDVARSVASAPSVRADVARYDAATLTPGPALTDELAGGQLQSISSAVQQRTGALFVVITDDRGIRLAHPTREQLGQHISADPLEALAGHETVLQQSGTLGESVRAKVPVLHPDSNRVVGEVSVGFSTAAVHQQLLRDMRTAAVMVGVALLIGIVGSVLLARRWRGLTLGLQPAELAELVRGQAAVLHGIGEGVLAADRSWKTTFVNDEACRLLEISNEPGRPVDEIGLTAHVLDVFKSADAAPTLATVGDRIVVVSARSVSRDGRDLGTVLVVRDRTDVESLTRQREQLLTETMTAAETERRRVSESIHDGPLQDVLVARQELDELAGLTSDVRIERALGCLHDASTRLREATFELHPAVLEQVGLAAAVEQLASFTAQRSGIAIETDIDYPARNSIDPIVFGVVRELLSNVVRHSHASQALVKLAIDDHKCCLDVTDNGFGIESDAAARGLGQGHIGLASHRTRVEAAGGTFSFLDEPAGTHVRVQIPLRR